MTNEVDVEYVLKQAGRLHEFVDEFVADSYVSGKRTAKATFIMWLKLHRNEVITEKLIDKAREQL